MSAQVEARTDSPTHRAQLFRGVWRIVDPKITLASAASMLLGGAIANAHGPIEVGWLLLTVIGVFFLEAAKNASGEIFDFDSGADTALREEERSPFSGGKRVLVDRLMTRRETALIAAAFYAIGAAIGLVIVLAREPNVLWFGIAGVALAYFYHAPPLRLAYRGLGELAVALSYGPLIACGTYLVQRGELRSEIVLASIPLGLSIAAFLWINEFPDARADASAGKRTLVVRLGRTRAARWFGPLLGISYATIAVLPVFGVAPGVWLGFLGLPHAVLAAGRLLRFHDNVAEIVPAQRSTLISFLLTAAGMAAGVLFTR